MSEKLKRYTPNLIEGVETQSWCKSSAVSVLESILLERDQLLREALLALSIATIEDDIRLAERYRAIRDKIKQHLGDDND